MKRTQTSARIRPIRHGDRDAIPAFFAGLSPGTSYLRFFTAAPSLGVTTLRMLRGDRDDVDVVVATDGELIIGHAMAVHGTGPDGTRLADIGIVVAEEWQDRGIGTALLRMLTARALARGAAVAVMDVLADNSRVLAMIRRRWPDASYDRGGISITVHASLWSPQQKGRVIDEPRRAAQHPPARIPVGGPRHLRRRGAGTRRHGVLPGNDGGHDTAAADDRHA